MMDNIKKIITNIPESPENRNPENFYLVTVNPLNHADLVLYT